MKARTTANPNTKRRAARTAFVVAAAVVAVAACSPRTAANAPNAASAGARHEPVADRTLVPRRIRLIIKYERPRFA